MGKKGGKKGKKKAFKKIDLTELHKEAPPPPPSDGIVLPSAPGSAQVEVDDADLPDYPPFKAFLGGVAFSATESDVHNFFEGLAITSVTLVKDQEGNFKGFGYVEFDDKQSLKQALMKSNQLLKGRNVRIDVTDSDDRGPRFGEGGFGADAASSRAFSADDWRRGDAQPAPAREPAPTPGFGRPSADEQRDGAGEERGERRGYGFGRGGFDRDERRDERQEDRRGGFGADKRLDFDRSNFGTRRPAAEDRGDRRGGFGGERRGGFGGDRRGGFGGDRRGGFGDERRGGFGDDRRGGGFGDDRGGFGGERRRGYGFGRGGGFDRDDRREDRRGGFNRDDRRGFADDRASAPVERPRIQLEERKVDAPVGQPASTTPDIFGGAKPVDNADKLLKAQEERERREREALMRAQEQAPAQEEQQQPQQQDEEQGTQGEQQQQQQQPQKPKQRKQKNTQRDEPKEPVREAGNKFSALELDDDM